MKITKDMCIGDILDMDVGTAKFFLEMGMHCLGCPASRGESVEQACRVLELFRSQIAAVGLRKGLRKRQFYLRLLSATSDQKRCHKQHDNRQKRNPSLGCFLFDIHICFVSPFLVLGPYAVVVDFFCTASQNSLCILPFGIEVFRHRPWLVSVSKSLSRHGIITARAKWMASEDATHRQDHPNEKASFLKRLNGIRRAGWTKATGWLLLERRE